MKSKAVRLYIRARRSDGARSYLTPAFAANGRLRPRFAIVDGQPQHCPEAVYSLRYALDEKRVWEDVGADPQLALLARDRKQRAVDAQAAGVRLAEEDRKLKTSLREAVADFLEDTRLTKSAKTAERMGRPCAPSPKASIKTSGGSRQEGRATVHRTIEGEGQRAPYDPQPDDVFADFLSSARRGNAHHQGDWPIYTEKAVACYRPDELSALMAAADQDARDMLNFFLCTGGRKQEVQFAAGPILTGQQKRSLSVKSSILDSS